jgi:hypothetical protein
VVEKREDQECVWRLKREKERKRMMGEEAIFI